MRALTSPLDFPGRAYRFRGSPKMSFFPGGHGGDRGLSLWHRWESSGHPLGQLHPGQHLQPSSSRLHGQGNMGQLMFPGLSADGATPVAGGDRGRDQGLGVSQHYSARMLGLQLWILGTTVLLSSNTLLAKYSPLRTMADKGSSVLNQNQYCFTERKQDSMA